MTTTSLITRIIPALALGMLLATACPSAAALVAHTAGDVCEPAADPCIVSQPVDVAAGASLDFGLRALVIQGTGLLDVVGGSVDVRSGRLDLATAGVAVRARAGADVTFTVRKRCLRMPAVACLVDADCASMPGDTCGGGDGRARLAGPLNANGEAAGRIVVRSAGDLALLAAASAVGTRTNSDGGGVELESTGGSIAVAANVDVSSGGAGSGGSVDLLAAVDVAISANVDATGGDYDGGAVSVDAGRDVVIDADLRVDAMSGGGFGGDLDVVAGRDILLAASAAVRGVVVSGDGHQSADNVGGDGGVMRFDAARDLVVGRAARVSASGAPPDGFADILEFVAGGDLRVEGGLVAKGRGAHGGGAFVDLRADGSVVLAPGASVDLTGAGAGGDLLIEAGTTLEASALVDVSAGSAGVGGRVVAVSNGDAVLDGAWTTDGAGSLLSKAELSVEGCHVRIAAPLVNAAASGRNAVVAHESLVVAAGGRLVASGAGAANDLRYRSDAKPPQLAGAVTPLPVLTVDASLSGCAVCGNAEVDEGEGCDDGNARNGDGCSVRCQDEGCEAATPGYPSSLLCEDGDECTVDACNAAAHRCEHEAGDCRDGVDCTVDSCVEARCVHEARAASCDDGNACTDDLCSTAEGCLHAAGTAPCDDGVFCNGADSCSGGSCRVHAGDPCATGAECADACDEAAASCLAPPGRACGDDANACTDDACDGRGACVHPANAAPCDDGAWCNGIDSCSRGACRLHAGDPCAAAGQCGVSCDEARDACSTGGPACTDDGNPCTSDACGADGTCGHAAIDGPCDDGDFCTVGESCSDGACPAPTPVLAVTALKLRRGGGDGRASWKATFPSSVLPEFPERGNLRVVLAADGSRPFVDTTLAAGSLADGGGAWRFKASRGPGHRGIVKAAMALARDGETVVVRFLVAGVDAAGAASADGLALALLFGDEPGAAPCASSGPLRCDAGSGGADCATPR